MNEVPGLGAVPADWRTERARWLLVRQSRPPRPEDGVVTAFRDGQVTLRSNRRIDGFTESVKEIGYQGIRRGDLVVHAMDGFAGAIGVSDSDGKASPVVHAYVAREAANVRYLAYVLRHLATNGYVASLARGIRERSTSFDSATLADVTLPVPSLEEQHRIADFLDAETARIDGLAATYARLKELLAERFQSAIDQVMRGSIIPLRFLVRFREGPGIMAADFRDSGVPLVRVSGLRDGLVTLDGCNYLDVMMVASRWRQFRLRIGDYVLSGSATMGGVSKVRDPSVVGAIPYTGLIILRPAAAHVDMEFIATALQSSLFKQQIDLLKTGSTIQHFGPSHLARIKIPMPSLAEQREIVHVVSEARDRSMAADRAVDAQLALLAERRQALITAAVTGQIDVTTARGVAV